jgi:hypothetical protein
MTNQPTCTVQTCEQPDRPIHDGAYACPPCSDRLTNALHLAARLAGEVMFTIARQDRVSRPSSTVPRPTVNDGWQHGENALVATPLPFSISAAADHQAVVNTLSTWARHIHEQAGRALPTVRLAPCEHASCWARRRGRIIGPTCAARAPEHPMAILASWLAEQVAWLRHRPEAAEAFDELADACHLAMRIIDTAAEGTYWGPCKGCGAPLRARARSNQIRCTRCDTDHDAGERRTWLIEQAMDQLAHAAWIAAALTAWGHRVSDSTIRKWAERSRLVAHGRDANARPLYLVADVWDLLVDAQHRAATRKLKAAIRAARSKEKIAA